MYIFFVTFLVLGGLSGCQSVERKDSPGALTYQNLSQLYRQTYLQRSSSLDVLPRMRAAQASLDAQDVDKELVTQSDTVIASAGRSNKGARNWFTLFAFDKYRNVSTRKFFFYMDENARVSPVGKRHWLVPWRSILVFHAEVMVGDVLTQSFSNEQQRRLAVVQSVTDHLRSDIQELGREQGGRYSSGMLTTSGMFMNQILRDALLELKKYPVFTAQLDSEKGVEFPTTNMGDGRLRVEVQGDKAVTYVEVGLLK
jgi:hypothetical protein